MKTVLRLLMALLVVGTALVCLPYLHINTANASAEHWGWFYAASVINDWSVRRGRADVEISRGKLDARLYEDGELSITLKGTVKDGRVEADATFHRTDAPSVKLTGTHGRVSWKTGRAREAILLNEPRAPWGATIGLTREREPQ